MANLWRTQRPRLPLYVSDGNGRDYYIKYNNAGYWENEYIGIQKKPDYDYPKYNNFHSLFHQAAPVKYIPTGNGRENYIINAGGLCHDQKPLASYKLDDFLRGSNSIENSTKFKSKKHYMSLGEKRYNNKLQSLEKQLIKRLYKIPNKSKNSKTIDQNENILPSIEIRKEEKSNVEFSRNYDDTTNKEGRLNTIESMPSFSQKRNIFLRDKAKRKMNKISLKNNFASIIRQSQQIEKYEMKNNARRSNNESDYNIYKNGRIGCRIKGLKPLINCRSENWKNKYRLNTERDQHLSVDNNSKKLKKNKLTFNFGNSDEDKISDCLN